MTELKFTEELLRELKRNNVSDAEDIVEEYRQHFAFKRADGYSEEEIAAKLGDPKEIAAQYDRVPSEKGKAQRVITAVGVGAADLFFGVFCIFLYAWETVMGAAAVSFGITASALITAVRDFAAVRIPQMPYHCALILGFAFAALSVLTAAGAIYFFAFVRQLMRSFGRFHKNTLAAASGKAVLPSLPVFPQFGGRTKRTLRRVAMISVIVFAVCFIAGFAACAITACSFEFWHTWGWFGYVG